ncbi:arginase-1 [Musca domestica]|uniref:Arginase n=1 Tax=Musca domestica TaxID=7370 RepID=T1P7Z2_MUSDO|nr:arginase-1 [Musca domestica]
MLKTIFRQFSSSAGTKTKLGILGVPFSKGQSKGGVEQAPDFLRQNGLVSMLLESSRGNLSITDYGNLSYELIDDQNTPPHYKNMKNYNTFMSCNKSLIAKIPEILKQQDQFLCLGGDHAIGFGSVAGHLMHSPNLSLVWVDAHADINLHSTSNSGNIHGMPVSFLLEELRDFWKHAHLDDISPNCLRADQLVYIGLRDIDPYEAYILNKLGIRAYAMDSIDKFGISKIMEMTLDALDVKNKIHISFDIDALDSRIAPSTGTAVYGGMSLREGIYVVETLCDTKRVQGFDLVEVNPSLGTQADVNNTLSASMEILKIACGGYRRRGTYEQVDGSLLKNE